MTSESWNQDRERHAALERLHKSLREKPSLPPAYGECLCPCHRTPGLVHVRACCNPPSLSDRPGEPEIVTGVPSPLSELYEDPQFRKEYFAELEQERERLNIPMEPDGGKEQG